MERIKASFVHFLLSALVVSTALAVVYFIWYPKPFSEMNNLWSVVKILVIVDLVLGPLLTLVVFNLKKPRRELKRDLAIIAGIQLCALGYGLHTMYTERPEYITYAIDRFEIVASSETVGTLDASVKGKGPFVGPHWVYVEPPKDTAEKSQITVDWMDGKGEIHQRRERYRNVPDRVEQISKRAIKPEVFLGFLDNKDRVEEANRLKAYAKKNPGAQYFPLAGRATFMVVAMDSKSGQIGEYFALEPFEFGGMKKAEKPVVTAKPPAPAVGVGVLAPAANAVSTDANDAATDLPD